jgi:LysR family glycine cleavage system transcriptional activator
MALAAAMAGEGVALGRSSLVDDDVAAGRLVKPCGPRLRSGLAYFLVTYRRPEDDSAAFSEWVKSEMRRTRHATAQR